MPESAPTASPTVWVRLQKIMNRADVCSWQLTTYQFCIRLNLDSGQFGWLRHQQLQKGFEQAFTPDPDVMHELKEAQVERQFFL